MNSDHTHTVIEKILEKYAIEAQADNYCLLQILPDGGEHCWGFHAKARIELDHAHIMEYKIRHF